MSRDSNINQFIPLHFYEPSEKLPEDESLKIVICEDGEYYFAFYDASINEWTDENIYQIVFNVIAWASFSPEWVTGTYPGEWAKQ